MHLILFSLIPFYLIIPTPYDQGATTESFQITFELTEKDKIIIIAEEEGSGKSMRLLFDTGANTYIKRSSIYDRDTIPKIALKLGNTTFQRKNIPTNEFNQSPAFTEFFKDLDGIFGYDLMRQMNWRIDFATQKMEVSDAPFKIERTDKLKIVDQNRPIVQLKIKGSPFAPGALIDTGSNGRFKLDLGFYELLKSRVAKDRILPPDNKETYLWESVHQDKTGKIQFEEISIAKKKYLEEKVGFLPGKTLIGMKVLKEYELVLNPEEMEVGLVE